MKTIAKSLKLGGIGIAALGLGAYLMHGPVLLVPALAGSGFLLMVIGFGLGIPSIEREAKQFESAPIAEPSEVEFRLLKLAEELRRPLCQRLEIFVIICLTVTPLTVAWTFRAFWPLVGLVFPIVLVIAVVLAASVQKYEVIKRAFISQLRATDRKAFIDFLTKGK